VRGVKQILETVARFRRTLHPQLHLSGIVVTDHDGRTQLGRQMLELLREEYPRDVLPVVIPRSVRTQETVRYVTAANAYLRKPSDVPTLLGLIRQHCLK
jgi:cellulose biosynthesis protein BcsQ